MSTFVYKSGITNRIHLTMIDVLDNSLLCCCSAKFQALLATPATEGVVVQRVCLALGAIAARGGTDTSRSFTRQAVQLARDACTSDDQVRLAHLKER